MSLLLIRTVVLYFLTLFALKAMGKRQLGQLQPFDFVVLLIISESASLAMQSNTVPLVDSVLPIAVLAVMQVLFSLINLKSEKMRDFFCGKPTTLILDGKLQEKELRRLRVDLNDILEQCRIQGYFDITELALVLMETNGQISILPKTAHRPLAVGDMPEPPPRETVPYALILDGHVNRRALRRLGYDENWLRKQLARAHIGHARQVFIAGVDSGGRFYYQRKQGEGE
ncbi:MAG: DUF421 domain-containing protein [Firmicutes bacterium]|nr:DUF421 domain-containing protein [Bacillota bacterium]